MKPRTLFFILPLGAALLLSLWVLLRPMPAAPSIAPENTTHAPLSRTPPSAEAWAAAPLFNANRRPPATPPRGPQEPAAEDAHTTPPRLRGIVMSSAGDHAALLENESAATRRLVSLGQVFEGWVVKSVSAKKVVLTQRGAAHSLTLTADPSTRPDTPAEPSNVTPRTP
ncbi:MAG: hypothetical protein RIR70_780 [Pseudomonadota bacterium]|jgi:type II secretory pathway component PulC